MESWNWVAQRLAHTILLVPKALGMPRRRPIMDGLRAYMAYAAAAFAGWVRAAWLSAWVARRCWSHARSAVHTTPRTPGTGTDTAVLLRWLAGNRSRAVLLGPEVTSSSVQSLTTAAVHHTVLYVLGGRRGGVTACCCRCSTAQHGTVQHRCDRDVCFPLLCRTQCRRICRRITTVSSRAVDTATALSRARGHVLLRQSVCLEPASNIHRLSLPMRRALRPNNLRHACTLFFSASKDSRRSLGGY